MCVNIHSNVYKNISKEIYDSSTYIASSPLTTVLPITLWGCIYLFVVGLRSRTMLHALWLDSSKLRLKYSSRMNIKTSYTKSEKTKACTHLAYNLSPAINRSWHTHTARQVTQDLFRAGDKLYTIHTFVFSLLGKLVLVFLPKEVLTFISDY